MTDILQTKALDADQFSRFGVEQDILHGETAPDSDVSVIKVAKEVLSGLKVGTDVTNVPLPASVLDPVSSLEKAMKSMQRGEYVPELVKLTDPTERFLGILRFFFSGLPKEKFGKKPYNPVLGEVYRCSFRHKDKSHGVSYLTTEQVSHHPPVTAINLSNPTIGFEMNSSNKPEPKFYGNHIDIKLNGVVRVYLNEFDEEYHLSRPNILTAGILGMGTKRVECSGKSFFACKKNNLIATIDFKAKGVLGITGVQNAISGTIKRMDTEEVLYELDGAWDGTITMTNTKTGENKVLFSAESMNKYAMTAWLPTEADWEPNNSKAVWKKTTEAIWSQDSKVANQEKKVVEDHQRQLKKEREANGLEWEPVYFEKINDCYFFKKELRNLIPEDAARNPVPTDPSPLWDYLEGYSEQTSEGVEKTSTTGHIAKRITKLWPAKVSK